MKFWPIAQLSLRNRLLLALLLTIFGVSSVWLAVLSSQMSRQQSGVWDSTLRSIATQLVMSMPADIDQLAAAPGGMLPPEHASFDGDKISFQVWTGQPRRLVVSSPGAGSTPLAPTALLREGVQAERYVDQVVAGQRWRVYSLTDTKARVLVLVGRQNAQYQADQLRWLVVSAATAGLLFLVLSAAVWLVVRWSMAPVHELQHRIDQRAAGTTDPLIEERLPEELRPLLNSFNVLLHRVETAIQTERRFIADAAHELRTPLAALLLHAEVAQQAHGAGDAADTTEALQQLHDVALRGARLSEQLLDSARLDASVAHEVTSPVELHHLVSMIARDFQATADRRQQTIELVTRPVTVLGHVDELGILIRNLVDNALRYSPSASCVTISCDEVAGATPLRVRLCVTDEGPGLPGDLQPLLLLQRFRRGSNSRERGSGIGLSLVARAVALHGASLEFGSGPNGRGLAVVVLFAAATAAASADNG
jgi:two-component system, OmpR family, sensor histidine kinase QseC